MTNWVPTKRELFLGAVTACVAALAAAGCAAGEPPSISNLALAPTTITAGEATQVTGGVDFEDADGDVSDVFFGLALDGEDQGETSQEVAGADGLSSGRAAFILQLQPPVPGEIDVSVWLVDAEGNESNTLSETIVAE
jgi:hypothetical protein